MNRTFAFAILFLLTVTLAIPAHARTYTSIIVDEKSGDVLHAVSPDRRVYPASLTKMMTLYLVFEALKEKKLTLDQMLTVSRRASKRPKSRLRLRRGRKISVRDAIGTLITKSANDVATVVAESLAGTEEKFAEYMTLRARQLGMSRTTFRNASGLPNRKQRSTARDIARLVIALRRDFPNQYHLFSMKKYRYRKRSFRNHNKLLTRYKGTDGVKTGFVNDSGYNIAVSVERHGRRLIAVVFGGKSPGRRDRQAIRLLNQAFKAIRAGDNPPLKVARIAPWRSRSARAVPRPVQIAPIATATINDGADRDDWAIQVGAFERFAPAHLAANRAARLAPVLGGARISVTPFLSGSDRLFRAQLVGLSETRADAACKTLKRKNVTCVAIPTGGPTAVGDR
ncbi:MAG: D-alanyl-D-alanine carboxypeptidase family protein [Alphaproteobacteria bacterium]